jgi:2-keto-4-pentenoate hydratase
VPVKGPSSLSLGYYSAVVLDITAGGAAQMYLVTSSPNDGLLGIGPVGLVTTALKTAVDALGAVTASTLTPVMQAQSPPWDSGGGAVLEFDGTWAMTGYSVSLLGNPLTSQMWLACTSPADGLLTSGDVTTVAAAVQTAAAALTDVTGCSLVTRPAVTPASVV